MHNKPDANWLISFSVCSLNYNYNMLVFMFSRKKSMTTIPSLDHQIVPFLINFELILGPIHALAGVTCAEDGKTFWLNSYMFFYVYNNCD